MKMQTLHCLSGHDWERPSQRGKPPRYCPEHRLDAPVATGVSNPTPAAAPKAPRNSHEELCRTALDKLSSMSDYSQMRKVAYCVQQILFGQREQADEDLMAKTLTDILRHV